MKWSKNLPTAPGWYWYRNINDGGQMPWARGSVVVEVHEESRGLLAWVHHMDYDDELNAENFPGEWAGPLEPPPG